MSRIVKIASAVFLALVLYGAAASATIRLHRSMYGTWTGNNTAQNDPAVGAGVFWPIAAPLLVGAWIVRSVAP